jgi:hypothetical protein
MSYKEIDTDNIEFIRFNKIKNLGWTYHESVPEISYNFLIYKYIKQPFVEAGYGPNGSSKLETGFGYHYWDIPDRYSAEELNKYHRFIKNGQVYDKAHVYIRKYKTEHSAYFESDQEAIDFIEQIKSKSTNKWQLIKID